MATRGILRSWWTQICLWVDLRLSLQSRRLKAELGAYEAELTTRLATAQKRDPISAAISMVQHAQTVLEEGKLDEAWLMYNAARRMEVESLDQKQLIPLAQSLIQESGKLSSKWRKNAIQNILSKPSEVNVSTVLEAMEIRDQALQNTGFKINNLAVQLLFLVTVALVLLAAIVFMAWGWEISGRPEAPEWIRLLQVISYGALGATVSTMLSLSPKGIEPRIPVQIMNSALAQVRPVLGATAAVAVYAFWRSGFLTSMLPTEIDYMALSFAAGFSDRLLLNAVGKILGRMEAKGKTPSKESPEPTPAEG